MAKLLLPHPHPKPDASAGRRGRREDPRLTSLPSGEQYGHSAPVSLVAPEPKTDSACELVQPLPLSSGAIIFRLSHSRARQTFTTSELIGPATIFPRALPARG